MVSFRLFQVSAIIAKSIAADIAYYVMSVSKSIPSSITWKNYAHIFFFVLLIS